MTLWLLLALPARADVPEDIGPWDLVRVDIPDYPGALSTSHRGSVLAEPPPPGTPWRVEELPVVEQEGDGTGRYNLDEISDAMGVSAWHAAGWRGQGVKVAVFDVQWYGAELNELELGAFQTHDCWAHQGCTLEMDTLRPRFTYESGSHGVGCAEVIRDLAPDVELHLVRVNGVTAFENAARWAVREHVDVVSLSMSFFNNSFNDGTGPVARIVEEMSAGGVLLVTSAGNYADGHWLEWFNDPDGDGVHVFPDGGHTLPVYLRAGRKRGLAVSWDNFDRCGDTDLDLYLYDRDGLLIDRATDVQDPEADRCSPVERLAPTLTEDQWTYLEVRRKSGDPSVRWNLITASGAVWQSMPEASVTDPGTHPLAFTVGAIRANGYLQNGPEAFSSQGPNLAGDPMPDIGAPDGLSGDTYGNWGFYGTSAASPSATAAVALVMSRYPDLDAFEAAERLKAWAWHERSVWQPPDDGLGAGHLVLPDPEAPGGCGGGPWRGAWIVIPFLCTRRRKPGGLR
ncbi:MAG: S8 family serine peptidase [Alphaproteobacteria bacterium]|nr:S8 family serine peptidase [Alphaproteobacteria bacterium]